MKYQLAILLLLIIATLQQNSITQLVKDNLQIEETNKSSSTQSMTQELLASIPNHNKPVLIINRETYTNSSVLSAIQNQSQRLTENHSSEKKSFTYSLEKVQQKRLQKGNSLTQQQEEPPKGQIAIKNQQKQEVIGQTQKQQKNFIQPENNMKALVDIEVSTKKISQKAKNYQETQIEEKFQRKSSSKQQKGNQIMKNVHNQLNKINENKEGKKEKNQTLQVIKSTQNDIKIIPLSSQYGKNSSKVEQNKQKTSVNKHKESSSQQSQGKVEYSLRSSQAKPDYNSKLNKKEESVNQKSKQNSTSLSTKQSKKLQKLIQQVKNTKEQLPQQSKKQIIQYLQTKKKEQAIQIEQKPQAYQKPSLNQQNASIKEESEYALVIDEIIEMNQQTKSDKQMNNSTIFVIMILTMIISIPIVKEIRSRNDQDQESKLNKGNAMLASNQKLQKAENQKDYNELNNQSGEEIVQRIDEEII